MFAAAAAQPGAGGAGAAVRGPEAGGPGLAVGGGVEAWATSLNEWGRRVDASLGMMTGAFSALREEVLGTQTVLATTIHEAKVALNMMHEGFRQALSISAAEQRASVEALITHARVKFIELEVKLEVLNVSAAQAMATTEQWALGEGARTAAQIQALRAAEVTSLAGTPPASPRLDPFARQDPWQSAAYGPQRGGAAFQQHPQTMQQPAPQMAQQPAPQTTPPGVPQLAQQRAACFLAFWGCGFIKDL